MVSLQKIFRHTLFSRAYFRCSNLYTRFLFFSLFTFTIVLLLSCGNSDKELNEYNSKALGIEEIKDADINYTLGGNAKAKLRSPLMLRVQEASPYVEFPKKLHVDFFSETGTVDSRLDALYGKYLEMESKVFLKDSVKVINILGDTLYCNELWWDRSRKGNEFYTDKPVRIRRKLQIIDGIGMDASQDFKAI
ncbi:MAG: LPS export ABC transporter periplasmic protein LptC [Chitinophagaceae bacterium]|nr:LPS export ABC transporter periplasmic protein LptC [Chitinophagaceae bacterium]